MVADDVDVLALWAQTATSARARGVPTTASTAGIRFAFYGRISTPGHQDEASSHQWQFDNATRTVTGAGTIVRRFFDPGYSRSLAWTARPQARLLLDLVADRGRDFDAIVVGEYDRGFAGNQLLRLLPYFRRHGVAVWLPELGGPVDPDDPTHRALIMMLGHRAQREVLRARFRTTAAMRVQVRDQGRFLGGRPPYGYRIVDAGPHPNPDHARWGRRSRRLDPDPRTAPHVRWIFTQRLAGHSVRVIAAMLDDRGIPNPAAADQGLDYYRVGRRWSPRAVDAILRNPRYTGRQVWNRYGIDHHEAGPGERSAGAVAARRPNSRDQWVISTLPAHPALISEQTFVQAQQISAVAQPNDGVPRRYLLGGLVVCARCGRRAESFWAHSRPAYRCRHGARGARTAATPLPFYAREDALLRAAASELDLRTGRGQTLWDDDSVAAHLRENGLRLRCGNDAFEIDGDIPKTTEAITVTRRTTSRQKRDKMVHRKRTIKRKKTLAHTGE